MTQEGRTLRAVFFDAGHTLLEPSPPVQERYSQRAAQFGAIVEPEAIRDRFRRLWKLGRDARRAELYRTDDEGTKAFWYDFVQRIFEPWLDQISDFDAFFDQLFEDFSSPTAWRVFDDVRPTLDGLRAHGFRLAVVSNWDRRLPALLDSLGIAEAFEHIVTSAEVGYEKPSTVIFEAALRELGLRPSEVLHLGDSLEEDVMGALDAGLAAGLVDRAGTPRITAAEDARGRPYVRLADLGVLIDVVEASGGNLSPELLLERAPSM